MHHIYWYQGHDCILPNVKNADNCYIYTGGGDRYIDLESGVWCTVIGHTNPRITDVIEKWAGRFMHSGYCYSNPVVEAAACEVLGITGLNDGKCVFLLSGSEAVEFCVRAVRSITEKQYLLVLSDSYLGAYGSINTSREDEWFLFDWAPCRSCDRFENCDPDCFRFSEIPFASIGGFVFEPGSASGLVRFPSAALVKNLAEGTKKRGGLVVVNEITTGMGRTGKWFGFQHTDMAPDLIAIGKGLGNGYPVSAAAYSAEVSERLDRSTFHSSQSHQNDPLGAAVAREVIAVIRENDLLERGTRLGSQMVEAFSRMAEQYSIIDEVRGRGMMMAVALRPGTETSIAPAVRAALMQLRYILVLRPGLSVFRIDPCLTIPQETVDCFLADFESIIAEQRDLL